MSTSLEALFEGAPLEVTWIANPFHGRWFADPFILEVTEDHVSILAEDWSDWQQIGRISHLTVSRHTHELLEAQQILELDTHLSFPAIIREGDDIYIHPENSASGAHTLYKYNKETRQCEKVEVMCNRPLTDAVTLDWDGQQWLFSTELPDSNGRVLTVFRKENGEYRQTQLLSFEENIARSAGDFFVHHGQLYRVAQECNVQYGHAVSIQKVRYQDGQFQMEEVRRLYTPHPKLNVGMHTLNMYKGVMVVDSLGFRHQRIRNVLKRLRNILRPCLI